MRADGATKSLTNGVSTRPITQQQPGFAVTQDNFRSDRHVGLTRREGFEWLTLNKLPGSPDNTTITEQDTVHAVTISGTHWWIVLRPRLGDFLMVDYQGNSHPTRLLNESRPYISGPTTMAASNDIAVLVNKNVTPAMDELTLRPNGYVSMIHCTAVLTADESASISFRTGTGAGDLPIRNSIAVPYQAQTETIVELATRIAGLINAQPGDEILAVASEATVTIQRTATATFSTYTYITVTGVLSIVAINGTVNSLDDLPASGPYLEIVEVQPDGVDTNLFLRLEGAEATEGEPPVDPPETDDPHTISFNSAEDPHLFFNLQPPIANMGYINGQLYNNRTGEVITGTVTASSDVFEGAKLLGLSVDAREAGHLSGPFYYLDLQFETAPARPPTKAIVNGYFVLPDGSFELDTIEVNVARDLSSDRAGVTYTLTIPHDSPYVSFEILNYSITLYPRIETQTFSESAPATIRGGTWREISKPGEPYRVVPTTTPHVIAYTVDAWELRPSETLDDRKAGTAESNPFILGSTLNDVAFLQSRLVFAAGHNVAMSQTNRFTNFFRQTSTQVLSTDPVDISHSAVRDTKLSHLVPHTGGVTVFSEVGQYKIHGINPINTETVTLPPAGSYPYAEDIRPVSSGDAIYFPNSFGTTSGLNAMRVESGRDVVETVLPLTDEVTELIVGDIQDIVIDAVLGIIVVRGTGNILYFGDIVEDRIAWSRHIVSFDETVTVERLDIVDGKLHALLGVDGEVSITNVPLKSELGVETVYLDFKVYALDVNTTITLDDTYPTGEVKVIMGEGSPEPGAEVYYTRAGQVLTLEEDMGGGSVTVGLPYESTYVPSNIQVRDGGGHYQRGAKLRINRYVAQVSNTGSLYAEVLSPFYTFPIQAYHGIQFDTLNSIYDNSNINFGEFVIPFRQDSDYAQIKIFTSHHTPATVSALEWEGVYNKRGRRF